MDHKASGVKRPAAATLLLAAVPFVTLCFSVALWDRLRPLVLGLPFNLFWLLLWIVLSSLCLWVAGRIEAAREERDL